MREIWKRRHGWIKVQIDESTRTNTVFPVVVKFTFYKYGAQHENVKTCESWVEMRSEIRIGIGNRYLFNTAL